MFSVYAHISKNTGKAYVGATNQTPQRRWKSGKGYSKTSRFGQAITKDGWDAFDHIVLYQCDEMALAKELEKRIISVFNLTNPANGYNETPGGDGGGMLGKHQAEDARKRISDARKRDGFTEEHKRHISESKTGIKHHHAKPVYQYAKDGTFIKKWDYMTHAAEDLHIQSTAISACCLGKRPSAGGYVWDYRERM